MAELKVTLSPDVIAIHPEARVAGVRVSLPDPSALVPGIDMLRVQARDVAEELAVADPITALPEIACWREAYAKMGVKPSKFHSSIEALLRRVKKGQDITTGLHVVDFYNLISVTQKAPIGAYDAAKFTTPELSLRLARPETDSYDPLGGHSEAFPLNPELVVYASGDEVLCWGFNTRDSKSVCVDENSTEILFFSESATAESTGTAETTIKAVTDVLKTADIETGPILSLNAQTPTEAI